MTAADRCPCCGARRLPLIDLVRGALEMEPDAQLARVMWLVGSRDMSMVATMVRMVRLACARATVQASSIPTSTGHRPVSATRTLPASLRACPRVQEAG